MRKSETDLAFLLVSILLVLLVSTSGSDLVEVVLASVEMVLVSVEVVSVSVQVVGLASGGLDDITITHFETCVTHCLPTKSPRRKNT